MWSTLSPDVVTAVRRDRQSPVMGTLGLVTLVLASLARAEDGAAQHRAQRVLVAPSPR